MFLDTCCFLIVIVPCTESLLKHENICETCVALLTLSLLDRKKFDKRKREKMRYLVILHLILVCNSIRLNGSVRK